MTVRLIASTFIVLSLVNAYSFVKLYSSTDISRHNSVTHQKQNEKNRTPAAIEPASEQISMSSVQDKVTFDLTCGLHSHHVKIKASGQWTQFNGTLCRGEKWKQIEIVNQSNGFTASVFARGEKYQTDLIQLNPGVNQIKVRVTPQKGPVREQTVVVESIRIN